MGVDFQKTVKYKDEIFKYRINKFSDQFKKGDKIKFIGIDFFSQIYYYLKLDTETIYEIENIERNMCTNFKLIGIEDIFYWGSFNHASLKEIRKEKLNALQSIIR